jgi:hypothetical protein
MDARLRPQGRQVLQDAELLDVTWELALNIRTAIIAGAAKQAKGAIKEAAGKTLGDARLVANGKDDKVEGKTRKPSAT